MHRQIAIGKLKNNSNFHNNNNLSKSKNNTKNRERNFLNKKRTQKLGQELGWLNRKLHDHNYKKMIQDMGSKQEITKDIISNISHLSYLQKSLILWICKAYKHEK